MEKHSILILDDEVNVLKSLERLLEEESYDIITVLDGNKALEMVKTHTPSLIISDYRMPGMNGVEFLSQACQVYPDSIRVMLTGFADIDAVIGAINKGEIYRYITKPWKEDEFKALIRDCLKQYELIRENKYLLNLTIKQNEELKDLNTNLEKKVEDRTKELQESNLKLKTLYEALEKSFVETVKIVLKTLEIKNEKLGIHAKRVAAMAVSMAQRMGLEPKQIRDIEIAGLFHDIGKVNMPSFMLFKTGSLLGNEQKAILRQHPVMGSIALSGVERLREVSYIVLCHHEHVNGGGYPYRKKGDEIPLGAKIIAVADTFENLTSEAIIGEKALTNEEAFKHIQSKANICFDPEAVRSLGSVMKGLKPAVKSNVKVKVSIEELEEGMVLASHIHTRSGILIMAENDVVSKNIIERIKQYAGIEPFQDDIVVYEK